MRALGAVSTIFFQRGLLTCPNSKHNIFSIRESSKKLIYKRFLFVNVAIYDNYMPLGGRRRCSGRARIDSRL